MRPHQLPRKTWPTLPQRAIAISSFFPGTRYPSHMRWNSIDRACMEERWPMAMGLPRVARIVVEAPESFLRRMRISVAQGSFPECAAISAWPRLRPPSSAGASLCVNTSNPAASSRALRLLEQVEVVKDAATQAYAIQRSTRPQEVTNSSKDFDQSIVKLATDF